mgnify:CR=1 FL=1
MSVLPAFEHLRAGSLDEVLGAMSFDDVPYAGGTELLLAMRMGLFRPRMLIDLKRIPELLRIETEDDTLVIGGSTTHLDAARHPAVREHAPMLASTLERVGNIRVRAQGTLGGNLCFAEPKSDVAAALIALDAEIELRTASASRLVPATDFILGPYYTVREPEELLTVIRIPLRPNRRGVYLKYQTMERPTVGVAAIRDGALRRAVVAAVGERPQWFDFDDDRPIDPDTVADGIEPEADLTGSVGYKRHVTRVFVERAAAELEASV